MRVELGQERLDEQRDVLAPLAQRRQLDREHVQPVEQVLAQLAAVDRLLADSTLVAAITRTSTDMFLPPAEAAEDALLQHAQQLHLRRRHHLGDLVEEQRAPVRQLEHAGAPIGGAGERPLLVAEDFALEQRLGNRGAVDRDEREASRAG